MKRLNIHLKMQKTTFNILITVAKTCEKVLRCLRMKVEFVFNNKSEGSKMKSYNKTVIDFNFGRHKDLPTLNSDIHLGIAASVNYHFSGR